jgi:Cu(I)/Ag(I) efflux system membrane fusion protein
MPPSSAVRDGTSVSRRHPVSQVLLTVLARLRFAALLGAIGFAIVRWDALAARYEKWAHPAGETSATADHDSEYFCPMHPNVVRGDNHEPCPICFMPLSKRTRGGATDAVLPPGTVARVQLTPYRVVLAGVRTTPVEYLPLTKEVLAVGTVEFDERGQKHVAARVKGRIDKLFVNQTGQAVHKGDPLADLYSPDLVVTVQNLLDAKKAGNDELRSISRDRLRLWGIEADQLDELERSGKPVTHLTVRSPIDGHVVKRFQTEGRYVDEGTPLYDVADLSRVWVEAQVYEDDLGFLPGEDHGPHDRPAVTVTTRAFPGEAFTGSLAFVYPHVDPDSRTLTARFETSNPGTRLRPGMTANVVLAFAPESLPAAASAGRFRTKDHKILAVPESSVIDTGRQKVVYREELPGVYDGVLVELGPKLAGANGAPYFPVLSGLDAGDRVVTAGSFLIDAETRLNPAAGSIYFGGAGGHNHDPQIRPSSPEDPDAKVNAALAKLSASDRAIAAKQKFCPQTGNRLGKMGPPPKLMVNGRPVFTCCQGCNNDALADPDATLKKVDELLAGN